MALTRVRDKQSGAVLVVDEAWPARWPDDFEILGDDAEQASSPEASAVTRAPNTPPQQQQQPRRDF